MSAFSKAELAGMVQEFFGLVGDIPAQVVLLDFLPGSYDTLTGDTVLGANVALPVQALVSRYRSPELMPDTVLSTDRKVAIRQAELPGVVPGVRDRVTMDNATWYVMDVHQDTGASLWVLQVRRDSEAD
jgi:hypothetical protein